MWRWEWSGIAFREKHCCSIQLPHHPTPPKKESEFPGWDIHKTCCNHIIRSSACPGMFSEDEVAKSNYNHLVGDFWQWLRQHTELDWTVSSRWQRKHSVHLPCQKTSHRLCRPSFRSFWPRWKHLELVTLRSCSKGLRETLHSWQKHQPKPRFFFSHLCTVPGQRR